MTFTNTKRKKTKKKTYRNFFLRADKWKNSDIRPHISIESIANSSRGKSEVIETAHTWGE